MKIQTTIHEYRDGAVTLRSDWLAEEREVRLIIDGGPRVRLSMSPGDGRAFVFGYLYTSGWIRSADDVRSVEEDPERIFVVLKQPPESPMAFPPECNAGQHVETFWELIRKRAPYDEKILPDLSTLADVYHEFHDLPGLFDDTGCVHSAALTRGHGVLFTSEDIGRHNAVDKTVGKALLAGDTPDRCFLLVSGRVSGEIIRKAFFAGIRAVVSPSAPTSSAVLAAREINMGLIGFLRGRRFNIY